MGNLNNSPESSSRISRPSLAIRLKRRRLFASVLIALAVAPGCRSIDCGWYTSRFGLTRADWTAPTKTEKPSPPAHSVPQNGSSPSDKQSKTDSKHPNSIGKKLVQLVGFTKEAAASDAEVTVAEREPAMDSGLLPNTMFTQQSTVDSEHSSPNPPMTRIALQPSVQGVVPETNAEVLKAGDASSNLRSFDLPSDFPGGNFPPIRLPKMDAGATAQQRQSIVDELFSELPKPTGIVLNSETNGREITLSELQDIALANNPSLQQAIARVENARGQMIQAGCIPTQRSGIKGTRYRQAIPPAITACSLHSHLLQRESLVLLKRQPDKRCALLNTIFGRNALQSHRRSGRDTLQCWWHKSGSGYIRAFSLWPNRFTMLKRCW